MFNKQETWSYAHDEELNYAAIVTKKGIRIRLIVETGRTYDVANNTLDVQEIVSSKCQSLGF